MKTGRSRQRARDWYEIAPLSCYTVGPGPEGVRAGRKHIQQWVLDHSDSELASDAALVGGELLANAHQHGAPPVLIRLGAEPTRVRLEISDASSRWPILAQRSSANMTGRGLALVDSLSASWGVRREENGGKTVWCELSSETDNQAPSRFDIDAFMDSDLEEPSLEPRFTVVLGDVPTNLLVEAKAHIDNLVREFSLAADGSSGEGQSTGHDDTGHDDTGHDDTGHDDTGHDDTGQENTGHENTAPENIGGQGTGGQDSGARDTGAANGSAGVAEVPEHLVKLIATVVHGFADAREAIKRQAHAAAQRQEARTSLTLHLPASAATAGEAYLEALDEADGYARAARLLTLETPPEHRLFRRWYVETLIDQLRRMAAGEPPPEVETFEARLLKAVRELSVAQRMTDRSVRLQRVTAALARARKPEDVASVVISEAVAALRASGGGLLVPAPDGEHLAVPGAVGYGDKLMGQFREERLDAPLPAATALRTGQAIWLESKEARDAQFPALRGFEPSTIAMCAVPLIVGERSIGALRFSFDTPKLFDEAERRFVTALAGQTAQTLLRTELYEAEREAAVGLQRALLPQALAGIPGWDLAAYYSPAGGNEVGGDFYDVVPISGGRIAAIVGDVMGRGLQAAAAMAEIRSTIRAYVIDDPDPATVFRRVDAFYKAIDPGQLVTVVYVLVDRENDLVQVINAGHLPPLLVSPGRAEAMPVAGGLPFGVDGDEREVITVRIPKGAAIVAITDGLVERRGEDIDVGVARLLDATAQAGWSSARTLMNRLVGAGSTQGAHDDDVTVLVVRRE